VNSAIWGSSPVEPREDPVERIRGETPRKTGVRRRPHTVQKLNSSFRLIAKLEANAASIII